jgi:hypothetical protein
VSVVWHILWPGLQSMAANLWMGVVSLAMLTPLQLWYMRVWSRGHTAREVVKATMPLHDRITELESRS